MIDLADSIYPALTAASPKYAKNWKGELYEFNEILLRRAYRVHNADFLQNCPVEKRLILDRIDCGWKVICDFVGKEIPTNVDYPHMNKKAENVEKENRFVTLYENHSKIWYRKMAMIGLLVSGLYVYRNRTKDISFSSYFL